MKLKAGNKKAITFRAQGRDLRRLEFLRIKLEESAISSVIRRAIRELAHREGFQNGNR